MEKTIGYFKSAAGKIGNWLDRLVNIFDSEDPIIIVPYRGYGNAERIFLKGRVLENEDIFNGKSDSEIRNIIDSFKRFETDEIPFTKVEIKIENHTFEVETDHEGYFILDVEWKEPIEKSENYWLPVDLRLIDFPKENPQEITAKGEIYIPAAPADFGVITDVDDTVLQTHVTSRFRLKMLYASFMQNSNQRLPMEGIVDLFHALVKGGDGKRENPIFYVSSSPWNLYDLLEQFMEVRDLPKGPILLRDYGFNPSGSFSNHKMDTISHVLETYPDLPFVMLGDTASRDADFYIDLSKKYPGQVKAIYIRQTRNNRNARRIAKLIEAHSDINTILINSSEDITVHAKKIGLISN